MTHELDKIGIQLQEMIDNDTNKQTMIEENNNLYSQQKEIFKQIFKTHLKLSKISQKLKIPHDQIPTGKTLKEGNLFKNI